MLYAAHAVGAVKHPHGSQLFEPSGDGDGDASGDGDGDGSGDGDGDGSGEEQSGPRSHVLDPVWIVTGDVPRDGTVPPCHRRQPPLARLIAGMYWS